MIMPSCRAQTLDRAIGLVALDDEPPLAGAGGRARAAVPRHRSATPDPRRARRSATAIIAAVVDFPCAPATTTERRSDYELREQLGAAAPGEREGAGDDDLPAVGRRGLSRQPDLDPASRTAVESTASRAAPNRRLLVLPTPARAARTSSSRRPPIPTIQSRLPSSKRHQLVGDDVRRIGPRAGLPIAAASRPAARDRRAASGRAPAHARAPARGLRSRRRRSRSAPRSAPDGRRWRTGTGRAPRGPAEASSDDGAAGARHHEARRRDECAEVLGERQHAVVLPGDGAARTHS